jgi:hypothetical protein
MSRALRTIVGVAASAGVVFIAGCGSSSSSDVVGGSTTSTTGTTQTAATQNQRLTSAQWTEYEASRAALRQANVVATATLKKCSPIAVHQNQGAVAACVGNTFTELTTAAGNSLSTLRGFQNTVSGPCATALAQLINQVGTFQASASQMQATINSPTVAGYPAASQDLELALNSGKAEAQTFEKDCAPS